MHDFESKSVDEIEADLKEWLFTSQTITNFNAFFYQVKKIIQKKNLILTPMIIAILADAVPSRLTKNNKKVVKAPYKDIDLSSLEYPARRIMVRLLYPVPVVAEKWESEVQRNRVRMWTVDNRVMKGGKEKVMEWKNPPRRTNCGSGEKIMLIIGSGEGRFKLKFLNLTRKIN